jgi:prevent-host-death family protein
MSPVSEYRIEIESSAAKALSRIARVDQTRIVEAIAALATDPRPHGATKLTGTDGWPIRVGDYRVVYLIEDTIRVVTVTRIGHRRKIKRGNDMTELVPISEAKARLSELVRDADIDDVLLLRHGRVAAVMMSARRYDALIEELEDLRDRLSIHELEGITLDFDKLRAELGV